MSAGPQTAQAGFDTTAVKRRRLGQAAMDVGAIVSCVVCVWFGLATLALDLPAVLGSFPAAPYALDGHRHLLAGSLVAGGASPYSASGFYYPPLGAIVAIPFSALGPDLGLWAWFALKIAILSWCVADATRGLRGSARALAALFVFASTYVLDDLWLGNVAIPMAAAIYLAVSRDRPWTAVVLGVVIAAVAKPFLVPLLVWMVVFRRRSAIIAIATAAIGTLVGVVLLGPGAFLSYLDALTGATGLDLHWGAGLTGIAPGLLIPVSIVVLAAFAILLWASQDETSLLLWSLLIGLIAAPYVGHYSVVPVLAAIPAFARAHPTRTLLLAAIAAPVSLVAIVVAAILGLAIAFPDDVLARVWRRSRTRPVAQPSA